MKNLQPIELVGIGTMELMQSSRVIRQKITCENKGHGGYDIYSQKIHHKRDY